MSTANHTAYMNICLFSRQIGVAVALGPLFFIRSCVSTLQRLPRDTHFKERSHEPVFAFPRRVSGYLSTFSPRTATYFMLSFFANCSSDRELTSWPCS